jgi:tetratricopeptide (TPR) repeat protein
MCASPAEAHGGERVETSYAAILSTALQHHQAGQLQQAAAGYEAILQRDPKHSEALYFLGIIAQQLGNDETAAQLTKAAIAQNPSAAQYHRALGNLYLKLNRTKEAEESFRQVNRLESAHQKSIPQELAAFGDLHGEELTAKCWHLGNLKLKNGLCEEAEQLYLRVLELKPGYAECYQNLGQALIRQNRTEEAAESFRKATALNPQNAAAYADLGVALQQLKNFSDAEQSFRHSSRLAPNAPLTHYNLGNLLRQQFRLTEAVACYRKALECWGRRSSDKVGAPSTIAVQVQVMNNLALTLNELGFTDESIKCYREALSLHPQNADLHFSLATTLLMSGNFPEGWHEHEWRWHMPGFSTKLRNFNRPLWKGESLHGEKILLHAEQGYGDTLQFVRYVPLVAARGGEVILEVPGCLSRLLEQVPGVRQVIVQGEPLPEFSWQCPLMSLPLAFGTTLDTIPGPVPYLSIPQETVHVAKEQWPTERMRVGLAWSGNPKHFRDAYRSAHLRQLIALSTVSGVSFYSLQVGEVTRQIAELSSVFPIADVCSKYTDFVDTAAFVAGLDLVITVDTSIAHLAGALGIPVWILLPHNRTDWRWLKNRDDSPWYTSARLFRQPQPEDWSGLAEQVTQELKLLARTMVRLEQFPQGCSPKP